MDKINHAIYKLEEAIQKAFEEEEENGVSQLTNDYELPLTLGMVYDVLDLLKAVLHSNFIKEPLEDVIFFVGKPALNTPVYHVLCRQETYERMLHDRNIYFMRMKQFNGTLDNDVAKTFDEQETITRARLTGSK